MALLKAGSSLKQHSPEANLIQDQKDFEIGKYRVSISQVNVMDASELADMKNELQQALSALKESGKYDLVLLLVTDILQENTDMLYSGEPIDLLEKAFSTKAVEGVFHLPGVLSRKKQVIPPLSEAAK